MTRVVQKLGQGLVLGLCVGAIVACQPATETPPPPATETDAETEQSTDSEVAGEATPPPESSAAPTAPSTGVAESAQSSAPEPEPIPPMPAECADPTTQMAMTMCAAAAYDQADTRLNNTYQAVKASVSAEKADQLVAAEQAWLTFRDLNCDFVASQYAGGSIEPMIYNDCMAGVTSDRTAVLDQTAATPASFDAVDRELNEVYQALQAELSPEDQEQLTDAQLAWLDYRDAHCAFAGGDMNTCLAQVTALRTRQLEVQLESRSL